MRSMRSMRSMRWRFYFPTVTVTMTLVDVPGQSGTPYVLLHVCIMYFVQYHGRDCDLWVLCVLIYFS
jgi:hypothetical protein